MGDRKREGLFIPPIGASSLLTAFAVLCLVVFALLALSTVRADAGLADASVRAVEDYYAADCAAQEILARLRNGEEPDGVTFSGGGSFLCADYAVPISHGQELQVSVSLETNGGGGYAVLRWQAAPTGQWDGGDGLDVWNGGAP